MMNLELASKERKKIVPPDALDLVNLILANTFSPMTVVAFSSYFGFGGS